MAASAGAIRAGLAYVELSIRNTQLLTGLQASSRKLQAWGAGLMGLGARFSALGALVTTPLLGLAETAAKKGADILRLSERTGTSVEALSALGYAADQAGIDMDSLGTALVRMERFLAQAATSPQAQKALQQLGISLSDLQQLTPEEQFKVFADSLASISDPAQRAAAAIQIFGRNGAQLLPLLRQGAAGIREQEQAAQEMGFTKTTTGAQEALAFVQAQERLWKTFKGAGGALGSALLPPLTSVLQILLPLIKSFRDWVRAHREAAVVAVALGGALLGVGVALTYLGSTVSLVGVALGGVYRVLTLASTGFGLLGAMIGWLPGPLTLLALAAAAVGGYFLASSGQAGQAFTFIKERLGEVATTASQTWQGIRDAIAGGDLGAALQVLWAGVKLGWLQLTRELQDVWDNALAAIQSGWAYTAAYLQMGWVTLQGFWNSFCDFAKEAWTNVTNVWTAMVDSMGTRFQTMITAMAGLWLGIVSKIWEAMRPLLGAALGGPAGLALAPQMQAAFEATGAERKQLDEQLQNELAAIEARRQAAPQANRAREEQAKAELDAALEAAKAAKERAALKPERPPLSELSVDMPELIRRVAVAGTFNVTRAYGFGVGQSLQERTAKASEETARNTRELLDQAQQNNLLFGD